MRGFRSRFYTSYEKESAILPTRTQKVVVGLLGLVVILIPFGVVPGFGFMIEAPVWFRILARVAAFGIAGLGLNLLTGVAGQVSLGHAFFMGLGAYTAMVLGGEGVAFGSEAGYIGYGLPMWIWLPGAALVPALIGVVIAPAAVRVRGLYLAFVTLGLVFIGQHFFRNATAIAGDAEGGRGFQSLELGGFNFAKDTEVFGKVIQGNAMLFLFMMTLFAIAAILHKNLLRSRTGRAWQSIRDRDIAAEVMGIPESRYKTMAFGVSSAYAGVGGALLAALAGNPGPATWCLNLSVVMIAIVLIGGAGTTAGPILGSLFVVLIPEMVEGTTEWLANLAKAGDSFGATLADFVIATSPNDFGLLSVIQSGPGISVPDFNNLLYGLLIILFLIFEPLGLFGIWITIRNYWKGWPFTY